MFKLLSSPQSNVKLAKSEGFGYLSFGLSLAPYDLSGHNVCSHASKGCSHACLNTSGMGIIPSVQEARIRKTKRFFNDRDNFLKDLKDDIHKAIKYCEKRDIFSCFRLNVLSDLPWEKYGIMEEFPNAQFYDYTKIPFRMERFLTDKKFPKNYHLTFSRSECNDGAVYRILKIGGNIAVVFQGHSPDGKVKNRRLPKRWGEYRVINGDRHDLRFLDPKNVIVGLISKGKAKKDKSGFVVV